LAATLAASGQRVVLLTVDGRAGPPRVADFGDLDVRVRSIDPTLPLADLERAAARAVAGGEVVVVAAPPINESTHALTWSAAGDGVLVVVQLGDRTEDEVRDAAAAVRIVGATVHGAVCLPDRSGARWPGARLGRRSSKTSSRPAPLGRDPVPAPSRKEWVPAPVEPRWTPGPVETDLVHGPAEAESVTGPVETDPGPVPSEAGSSQTAADPPSPT
jgi:hypothetical protein